MELVVNQPHNAPELSQASFLNGYNLSSTAISRIEELSNLIDANIVNMKTQWIQVGQSLSLIKQEFKNECYRQGKDLGETFNDFVLQRFGRKHSWSALSIKNYETFKSDTLIENASLTVLTLLNPLPNDAIDQIRTNLKPDQSLSVKQAKELVRICKEHQDTLERNSFIEQELAEALADKEKTNKQLIQSQIALTETTDESRRLAKSNDELMQSLRVKQQEATNILSSLNAVKQEKEDALRRVTELHKPQPTTPVEVEVPPAGYTSIKEALADIEAQRTTAQAELNAISAELKQAQRTQNLDSQIKSSLASLKTSCLDLAATQTATLLLLPIPITASQRTALGGIEKILKSLLDEIQQIA